MRKDDEPREARTGSGGPHAGGRVARAGAPIDEAALAILLLHGRGGTPESMLELAGALGVPDAAYLAPEARGNSWYPHSFLEPLEHNEPGLSSGLAVIAELLAEVADAGLGPEAVAILGFSQGGCLALEFAARNARRYGAVVGLSAGLIGPRGTARDYPGSFGGTPAFLGCSDVDPHIPLWRLNATAAVLERMGAEVEDWTGFLGSSRGILRGIDDYMETAERSMEKTLLLDYEITDMEIQVHGDVALVYYVADIRVLDRPTGEERSVPLRSLDVYKRGPDGWNQAGSHIGVIPSVDGSSPWAEPSGRD